MENLTKNISDWVGFTYKQFIMNDIFSFVIPGSIFLISLIYIPGKIDQLIQLFEKSPLIASLFWYGISYLLGFAIQSSGISFHLLKFYKEPPKSNIDQNPRYQSQYMKFQEFIEKASQLEFGDYIIGWNDKYMLLKQMTGNSAVAFFWSILFVSIYYIPTKILHYDLGIHYGRIISVVGFIGIAIFLYVDHLNLVNYWEDWRTATLRRIDNTKNNDSKNK